MRGEKYLIQIRDFSFHMGAFMSPNITIEFKDGKLYYSYDQFGSSSKRYKERIYTKIITPSEESWVIFFETFDLLNVKQWSHNTYRDDDVFDSISCKICIDITFNNDEKEEQYKVNANGYEVVPDAWDAFVKAIEKLIHESITSRTYNAQIMRYFMEDSIKGEEYRRNLFAKISPMVLEIIEGGIAPCLLDYDIEDILEKYMNLLRILGVSKADKSIMQYIVWACEGIENKNRIDILNFIDPSMKDVYEDECRSLLSECGIWILSEEAQKDIDTLFKQTRMVLLYINQRHICCESYRHDEITLEVLSLKLAEKVSNLKKYTDENMITHESYSPKSKVLLTAGVGRYLEHIEREAKKIKEIECCMRQYDYTLLKDEAVHDLALVLSNKIFDEILKFVDRLHIIFQGAELITKEFTIQDSDIVDLILVISKNHDFSIILPLIQIFCEEEITMLNG